MAVAAVLLSVIIGGGGAYAVRSVPGYEPLLLVGLLVAVPVIVLALARYHLAAFCAFASVAVVRWEPAPVDLMVALLLAVGLLAGQLRLATLRESSLIHSALWLFVSLNLIALLGADDLRYSLRYTAITCYLIALCYFVRLYVTSVERMRIVLFGCLAAALSSVMLVALELAGLSPTNDVFVFENRARALFKDANVFAPFLVLPIIFLLDELLRPTLIVGQRWLKLAAIVVLGAGVLIAFSRAAWANLLIAVATYMVLAAPHLSLRQWVKLLLPGILGAAAMIGLIVWLGLAEFLRSRASLLQSYDTDRFGTQLYGIGLGMDHLFGIGPGMLFNAHSLYVRTFAEYGVFGLVALGTLILVPVARCLRRALRADDRVYGLSARVVVAVFAGLLFNSIVIDTIHWRSFWIMIALAWVVAAGCRPVVGGGR